MEQGQSTENIEEKLIESNKKIEHLANLVHNLADATRTNSFDSTILNRVEAKVDIMAQVDPTDLIDTSLDEFKLDFDDKYGQILEKIDFIEQQVNSVVNAIDKQDNSLKESLIQEVKSFEQNFQQIKDTVLNLSDSIKNISPKNAQVDFKNLDEFKQVVNQQFENEIIDINNRLVDVHDSINNILKENSTELNENIKNISDNLKDFEIVLNQSTVDFEKSFNNYLNSAEEKNKYFQENMAYLADKLDYVVDELKNTNSTSKKDIQNIKLEICTNVENLIKSFSKSKISSIEEMFKEIKINLEKLQENFLLNDETSAQTLSGKFNKLEDNITDINIKFNELYNSLNTDIKEEINSVKSNITESEEKIFLNTSYNIKTLETKLEETQDNLITNKETGDKVLINKFSDLEHSILDVNSRFNELYTSLNSDIKEEIGSIKDNLTESEEKIFLNTSYNIKTLETKLEEVQENLVSKRETSDKDTTRKFNDLEKRIVEINTRFNELYTSLNTDIKEEINSVKDNITESEEKIFLNTSYNIKTIETKLDKVQEKLISKKETSDKDVTKKFNKLEDSITDINGRFNELYSSLNNDIKYEVGSLKEDITGSAKKIVEIQKLINSIPKDNKIKENIYNLEEKLEDLLNKFVEYKNILEDLNQSEYLIEISSNFHDLRNEIIASLNSVLIEATFIEESKKSNKHLSKVENVIVSEINSIKDGFVKFCESFEDVHIAINQNTNEKFNGIKEDTEEINEQLKLLYPMISNFSNNNVKQNVELLEDKIEVLFEKFNKYETLLEKLENIDGLKDTNKTLKTVEAQMFASDVELKNQVSDVESNILVEIDLLKKGLLQLDKKFDNIENISGDDNSDKIKSIQEIIKNFPKNNVLIGGIQELDSKFDILVSQVADYQDIIEEFRTQNDIGAINEGVKNIETQMTKNLRNILTTINFLEESRDIKKIIGKSELNLVNEIVGLKQSLSQIEAKIANNKGGSAEIPENLDEKFDSVFNNINSLHISFFKYIANFSKELDAKLAQSQENHKKLLDKIVSFDFEENFDLIRRDVDNSNDKLRYLIDTIQELSDNQSNKKVLLKLEDKVSVLSKRFDDYKDLLEAASAGENNSSLQEGIDYLKEEISEQLKTIFSDFNFVEESTDLKNQISDSSSDVIFEIKNLKDNISSLDEKFESIKQSFNSDNLTNNDADIDKQINKLSSTLKEDFNNGFAVFKEELDLSNSQIAKIQESLQDFTLNDSLKKEFASLENKFEELVKKSFEYKKAVESDVSENKQDSQLINTEQLETQISSQLKKIVEDLNFVEEIQSLKDQISNSEDLLKNEIRVIKGNLFDISKSYGEIKDISLLSEQNSEILEQNEAFHQSFPDDISLLRDQIVVSNNKLNDLNKIIKNIAISDDVKNEINTVLEEVKFLNGKFTQNFEDLKEEFDNKIVEINDAIQNINNSNLEEEKDSFLEEVKFLNGNLSQNFEDLKEEFSNKVVEINDAIQNINSSNLEETKAINANNEAKDSVLEELKFIKEHLYKTGDEISSLNESIVDFNDELINSDALKDNFSNVFNDIQSSKEHLSQEISDLQFLANSILDRVDELKNVSKTEESSELISKFDELTALITNLSDKKEDNSLFENINAIQEKVEKLENVYSKNNIDSDVEEYVYSVKQELTNISEQIDDFKNIVSVSQVQNNSDFNELVKEINSLTEKFNNIWAADLTFDKMSEQIFATREVTESFHTAVNNFVNVIDESTLKIGDLLDKTGNIELHIGSINEKLSDVSSQILNNRDFLNKDILQKTDEIISKIENIDSKVMENTNTLTSNIAENTNNIIVDLDQYNQKIHDIDGKLDNIYLKADEDSQNINTNIVEKAKNIGLSIEKLSQQLNNINSQVESNNEFVAKDVLKKIVDLDLDLNNINDGVSNTIVQIENLFESNNVNKQEIQGDLSKIDAAINSSGTLISEKLNTLLEKADTINGKSDDNLNDTGIIKDALIQIAVWIDTAKDLLEETNTYVNEIKNNDNNSVLFHNMTEFIDDIQIKQTDFIVKKSNDNFSVIKELMSTLDSKSKLLSEKFDKIDVVFSGITNKIDNSLAQTVRKIEQIDNSINESNSAIFDIVEKQFEKIDLLDDSISANNDIILDVFEKNFNKINENSKITEDGFKKSFEQVNQLSQSIGKIDRDSADLYKEVQISNNKLGFIDENINKIEDNSKTITQGVELSLDKLNLITENLDRIEDTSTLITQGVELSLDRLDSINKNISSSTNMQEIHNTMGTVAQEVSNLATGVSYIEEKINENFDNFNKEIYENISVQNETNLESIESKLSSIKKSINLDIKKVNDRFSILENNIQNIESKIDDIHSKMSKDSDSKELKPILEFIAAQVSATNENSKINSKLLNRVESLEKRMSCFDNNLRDLIDILKED